LVHVLILTDKTLCVYCYRTVVMNKIESSYCRRE
jgi:hypothetical protein